MSLEQAERFVQELRDRRMKLRRVHEEGVRLKADAQKAKMLEQLERVLHQMTVACERADKALTKAETYINKVMAIKLQVED